MIFAMSSPQKPLLFAMMMLMALLMFLELQITLAFSSSSIIRHRAHITHLFEDEETCVVKSVPSECVFRPVSSKKTRSYKVATRVASGFQCGKKKEIKPGDDWAVLRLKESVPGVAPYKLPIHESSVLEFDEKVLSVLGASRDFPKTDKKGIKFFPPTIEECAVKNIRWVSGGGAYVKTDCDGSLLSSGGSLLRPTNDGDVLLGVFKGTQETTEMANAAAMTNRRTQKTYNSEDWFSVFVSVSGDFLKALQAAIRNP